jgi:hypothetical protein
LACHAPGGGEIDEHRLALRAQFRLRPGVQASDARRAPAPGVPFDAPAAAPTRPSPPEAGARARPTPAPHTTSAPRPRANQRSGPFRTARSAHTANAKASNAARMAIRPAGPPAGPAPKPTRSQREHRKRQNCEHVIQAPGLGNALRKGRRRSTGRRGASPPPRRRTAREISGAGSRTHCSP